MTVTIKTPEDIEKMRVAGRLAAEVLEMIGEHVKPGVTTEELDRLCHDYIVNVQQATPAPLNYKGFFKSICISSFSFCLFAHLFLSFRVSLSVFSSFSFCHFECSEKSTK